MHAYLIELIWGSDMDIILNYFFVFLYPNTPNVNVTRDKILDLSFHFVFKENKINFNIPNFCSPVYFNHCDLIKMDLKQRPTPLHQIWPITACLVVSDNMILSIIGEN